MIPLCRPVLPSADELMQYLERIDWSGHYTNFGPLVMELEERLGKLFEAPVVTASSGTSALTASIMALGLWKGSMIGCPSWTFQATAAAIVAAGHVPVFIDTDEKGMIDVSPYSSGGDLWLKALIVVAPFGGALDIKLWEKWEEEVGCPVIIDAAAGFDAFSTVCKPGKIPVIISTHATKAFGTGEGGFVTCRDENFLKDVRHITNFGIESKTSSPLPGLNAKMSEYHAAVGLAELDGWPRKRERWKDVDQWYREETDYKVDNTHLGSLGLILSFHDHSLAAPLVEKLRAKGIHAALSRYGVHVLEAYKYYLRIGELHNTKLLIEKTLLLPCSITMTKYQVKDVVEALQCA